LNRTYQPWTLFHDAFLMHDRGNYHADYNSELIWMCRNYEEHVNFKRQ